MQRRATARMALLAGWLVLLGPAAARASGIMVARFGGEMGHPTTANPTAIYFNPAGMALEAGHRLFIDIAYGLNVASYDRSAAALSTQPPSELTLQADTGRASLSNTSIVPFIGAVSDLGTGLPLGVGVAFYAPFGGQSVFDRVAPVDGAPGAVDGPARWWTIEGTLQTLTLSAGGAYRFEAARLSLGLTVNVFFSTIDALQAQTTDGTDDVVAADGSLKEGRVRVDATGTDVGMGFGALYEPVPDVLWVGASYQSRPNFGGVMELDGTVDSVLGTAPQASHNHLLVRQQMPDTLRLGLRYRPISVVELRLFGDWTRWSAFDSQCFVNTDVEHDPERACQFHADGSQVNPDARVLWNAIRRWHDTFGVRLGASYWVVPSVELMLGTGFDRNAIPDATLEPGLLDFDIVTAALGARIRMADWAAVLVTATNWFALTRDTRGSSTFSRFAPPSRQPNSAGVYKQNILTFNLGLEVSFGGRAQDGPAAE